MKQQHLVLKNIRNENINLIVSLTESMYPRPVVCLVQGIGMDMHEYKNAHDEIAKYLTDAGIAAVQFDFSYHNRFTDKLDYELPLSRRAGEVETVVDWITKQEEFDNSRTGILSMSFGVSTVLRMDTAKVKSLCLVSGLGFRPQKFLQRYIKRGDTINRTGITRLSRSSGKTMMLDADFWPDFDRLRQEELAVNLAIPTLVIHGSEDSYITSEDMYAVYEQIPVGIRQLKYFDHGDHGMTDVPRPMREEFLQTVTKWFSDTLK